MGSASMVPRAQPRQEPGIKPPSAALLEKETACASRGRKDRARAHAIRAQKPHQSQRREETEPEWCESYNQSYKEEERGVGKSTADRDEEGKR